MATMSEQHLALADRHIAEAEARVGRQRALVAELAADGRDAAGAEELLGALLMALDGMRGHRATLLAEIAAERSRPAAP